MQPLLSGRRRGLLFGSTLVSASLVPPLLRAGDHTITAQYEGTEDLAPSEATAELEVRRR